MAIIDNIKQAIAQIESCNAPELLESEYYLALKRQLAHEEKYNQPIEKRVIRLTRTSDGKPYDIHAVTDYIRTIKGYHCELDPECNPVTYWLYTDMPLDELRRVDGVFDAI